VAALQIYWLVNVNKISKLQSWYINGTQSVQSTIGDKHSEAEDRMSGSGFSSANNCRMKGLSKFRFGTFIGHGWLVSQCHFL